MSKGALMQVGTPRSIYFDPENSFVADSIEQGTFLHGRVTDAADVLRIDHDTGDKIREVPSDPNNAPAAGESVLMVIRPENLEIGEISENRFR